MRPGIEHPVLAESAHESAPACKAPDPILSSQDPNLNSKGSTESASSPTTKKWANQQTEVKRVKGRNPSNGTPQESKPINKTPQKRRPRWEMALKILFEG